jgi:hypothetical protein
MNDPTHNIHNRQLPLAMRRSISTPEYVWDRHDQNIKPDQCLATRWEHLFQMIDCAPDRIAGHHYQLFLNFTAIANTPGNLEIHGKLQTNRKFKDMTRSISLHAIDSTSTRVLYCDRSSDSPRLRPLSLSSPFSFETWVTLGFLLILCAIARSFTILDMHSFAKDWTTTTFIKTVFNSLFELIICLFENDVGKNNFTKAFIGVLVICLGNNYKNYLTIQLVYPRAGDAISNLTELLDFKFSVITSVVVEDIGKDKSTWLKDSNYHLEIDETKREKYVREAERWFKLMNSETKIRDELAPVTSKNAWIVSMAYHFQVYNLNLLTQKNYPLSCHFVKRPLAHEFSEFYFFNPKAEEFKWWTAKFLDHGLFVFWKRLESHMVTLYQQRVSLEDRPKRSNSSSVGALDAQNFIGQVHLIVFYIVIGIITVICFAIFLLESAIQNAQVHTLFVQIKHYSLQLLWTIFRPLSLLRRLIGRLFQKLKSFKIILERARIDNISVNKIHKIEVKPNQ